ncbi:MAG TPA: PAS domain S-box protein [Deltaproteobacteria bacterium]|nr:PAS domain S-box protein [Deltaproteobacteria bacterium]HPR51434.1 PAS domain S-box protein [Deltaproteobacteria bacterium]
MTQPILFKGKAAKKHKQEEGAPVYKQFFEESNDALYITDIDGVIKEVNKTFITLFGYRKNEIIGEDVRAIYLHDDDKIRLCQQIKKSGFLDATEVRFQTKDKTVLFCQYSCYANTDPSGNVVGYTGIIRDITELKNDQEALRKKTRDLSEKIKELDFLFEISTVLERKAHTFDETVQGVIDLIPRALNYSDIACARITLDGKVYASSNFQQTPWRMAIDIMTRCHLVGTLEIVYLEDRPLCDVGPFSAEEKRLGEMVASRLGRLFSRKQAEEMLSQSEARYRSLFEDSRDAIYTTSRDGIVLDANQATLDLFGYSREEMIGMDIQQIYVNPEERMKFQRDIEDRGSVRDYDVWLKKKDRSIMNCLYTSSVRRSGEGDIIGYHCIIRDITEQRGIEEERQGLIEELTIALDKIRTMRGLIPICATCKKIRDDRGYWNHLEEYIEAHSDAVFSHGLCPECQRRFEEED